MLVLLMCEVARRHASGGDIPTMKVQILFSTSPGSPAVFIYWIWGLGSGQSTQEKTYRVRCVDWESEVLP